MSRDMIAIAEAIGEKIPYPYDLTMGNLQTLYAMGKAGKHFDAYVTAFRYGYAMALRATKRQTAAAKPPAKRGRKPRGSQPSSDP